MDFSDLESIILRQRTKLWEDENNLHQSLNSNTAHPSFTNDIKSEVKIPNNDIHEDRSSDLNKSEQDEDFENWWQREDNKLISVNPASEDHEFDSQQCIQKISPVLKPLIVARNLQEEEKEKLITNVLEKECFFTSLEETINNTQSRRTPMVRFGEYSPQNPNLLSPGKCLLGLGEYEEKRKRILQRKNQELRHQLSKARLPAKRDARNPTGTIPRDELLTDRQVLATRADVYRVTEVPSEQVINGTTLDSGGQDDRNAHTLPLLMQPNKYHPLSPRERKMAQLRESYSPSFGDIKTRDALLAEQQSSQRRRREAYNEELNKQIQEKQQIDAELREKERRQDEAIARRVREQRERMQREYEREEANRRERQEQRSRQADQFQRRQEALKREAEEEREKALRQRMERLQAAQLERSQGTLKPEVAGEHEKVLRQRMERLQAAQLERSQGTLKPEVEEEEVLRQRLERLQGAQQNIPVEVDHTPRPSHIHYPPVPSEQPCDAMQRGLERPQGSQKFTLHEAQPIQRLLDEELRLRLENEESQLVQRLPEQGRDQVRQGLDRLRGYEVHPVQLEHLTASLPVPALGSKGVVLCPTIHELHVSNINVNLSPSDQDKVSENQSGTHLPSFPSPKLKSPDIPHSKDPDLAKQTIAFFRPSHARGEPSIDNVAINHIHMDDYSRSIRRSRSSDNSLVRESPKVEGTNLHYSSPANSERQPPGALDDSLPIMVLRAESPVLPAVRTSALFNEATVPNSNSEAMRRTDAKWQIPAVQKSTLTPAEERLDRNRQNVLTQLGAFRQQMQLQQIRLEERLRKQSK